MKNEWVFGATEFSGNSKWLYLYLAENHPEYKLYWLADNSQRMRSICKNLKSIDVIIKGTKKADLVLSKADVYVSDQFREYYPDSIGDQCIHLNLWHGVGLKSIETKAPYNGGLSKRIAKKNITYFDRNYRKTLFLVTSADMEKHFSENIVTPKKQFIQADYPRICVPKLLEKYEPNNKGKEKLEQSKQVILYAPTFRDFDMNGSFANLIPNIEELKKTLEDNNSLFIMNLHPAMREDEEYKKISSEYKNDDNFIFIEDGDDIYEYFQYVTYSIIDYSSIYYDLMAAGQDKFVRYTPDYDQYIKYHPIMSAYYDKTYGTIVSDFNKLLATIKKNNQVEMLDEAKKKELMDYFYNYSTFDAKSIEKIIDRVQDFTPTTEIDLPTLRSYDIFDTLIYRSVAMPEGIFYYVQEELIHNSGNLKFPKYFYNQYFRIRKQAENAARDTKRKTQFERESNSTEINFDDIFNKMMNTYQLSKEQVDWLKNKEIEGELKHVRKINHRVKQLFEQHRNGDKIILISDMYLPEKVIKMMLEKVDKRLLEFDLYVSSEIGHQKTSGILFQYVFFNSNYKYKNWIHYGDNDLSDKKVPATFGIEIVGHNLQKFTGYEKALVTKNPSYGMYLTASIMRDFRASKEFKTIVSQADRDSNYYGFSYMSLYLVPYVDWAIERALKDNIDTLYFITRDGLLLKKIADVIIQTKKLNLKTKLFYGSRKAWRVAGIVDKVDDSVFSYFGLFQSFKSFEDLLNNSEINEAQFDKFFPMLKDFKTKEVYSEKDYDKFRKVAQNNENYKTHLLEVAVKKRRVVSQYVKQEINPNEKFVFIEYWARGYTQDSLTNICKEAFGKDIDIEFYYSRSIYDSKGSSKRANFTNSCKNIIFVESIFNTVPMKTVTGYTKIKNGQVIPTFEKQRHKMYDIFESNILKFTKEYAKMPLNDKSNLNNELYDFSISYFHANSKNKVISNNFGKLKNNIALNGKEVSYAPIILARTIVKTPIYKLKRQTKSLPMSMKRSSDLANKALSYRENYERLRRRIKLMLIRLLNSKENI
ncbi:CDP-glycerol glycerophosphotransferase family protein [Brochothrix thermosphacta]|uniref:CDP-glycerol glycerophosphotransferase family protein n=1 Tax=Brochothrix thermosphacta TaxID=2756 RepID=UPI0027128DF7|nr:CDP-glycerol glycerophosphotransferase family protein [Brochothrix thermosphacta]MDO7864914.1 CDP-glycerol glycerophosphotransferase family protein [Brochothrix thermosphacta]